MQIAQPSTRPLPVARRRNLIVKELPDETLIYDLDSDQAHCLNQTAALVWKNCDGSRSARDLAALLSAHLGTVLPEAVVWVALDQLQQFKLLSEPVSRPTHLAAISRRQLIRTLGIAAAISIPAITSIVAPTPAQAASCGSLDNRDAGCPCSSSSQCASGCCHQTQFTCKSAGQGCL
jgi:hypothetical protein